MLSNCLTMVLNFWAKIILGQLEYQFHSLALASNKLLSLSPPTVHNYVNWLAFPNVLLFEINSGSSELTGKLFLFAEICFLKSYKKL